MLAAGLGLAAAAACSAPAAPRSEGAATPLPPATAAPPAPTAAPAAPPACDDPLGCYGEPQRVGAFDAEAVPEASGLAASRRNPGVLYLVDDAAGTTQVWALADDGTMLGAVAVSTLDAADTEDLAVGPCGPGAERTCLYIGDIGDHDGARDGVLVHRLEEPDLSGGVPERVDADVARLRYPDGWHDAETLLVDDAGALHLVTKARFDPDTGETGEHRLYRAPGFADATLEDVGAVPVPEPSTRLHSGFVGNVVTAGDAAEGRVVLRTYDQVLEFVAADPEAPLASFPSWPVREAPGPFEPQSEAIAWAADGCGFFTAGEQTGTLWLTPCADDRAQ